MPLPFQIPSSPLPVGLSVIEASAGTGKTYTISHLVPRMLLEGTVRKLSEILLVTFTNAATRELSERVRKVLSEVATGRAEENPILQELRDLNPHYEQIIHQALLDIDQLHVSTIHSFCQRTLQAEGPLCGLPTIPELIMDADEDISLILHDLWVAKIASDPTLASIARAQKWSMEKDLKVVSALLQLDDYQSDPAKEEFLVAYSKIQKFSAPAGEIDALQEFMQEVTNWKTSGEDEPSRTAYLDLLKNGGPLSVKLYEAIQWTACLQDHIKKSSEAAKALWKEAATLQIIRTCTDYCAAVSLLEWQWRLFCADQIRATLPKQIRSQRQITQDGLISTLRDALRNEAHGAQLRARLQERYKVALIDESQDTDPRQFEIFRLLFTDTESHRLILIGDPKQAIYGFRGADVNTYLKARDHAKVCYTLSETYRAPEPLVTSINKLFSRPTPFVKQNLVFEPARSASQGEELLRDGTPSPRVTAWVVSDEQAGDYSSDAKRDALITATVTSEIVSLLRQGKLRSSDSSEGGDAVQPHDIAILVRSRKQADKMADMLQSRGVPAVVTSGADVMDTDEARELLSLLKAVTEPRRAFLRYAALATRLMGRSCNQIADLRSNPAESEKWLDLLCAWQAIWYKKGVAAFLAAADQSEKITQRLASLDRGDRRVTNLRQISDLLIAAEQNTAARPAHLLRWLEQSVARAADRASVDEREIQLESDAEAVQILTTHAVKGLEFNLVFCPYLWDCKTPKDFYLLRHREPSLVQQIPSEKPSQEILDEVLSEDLRLTYVALTRAKVALWFYAGATKDAYSSLDHLLDRPREGNANALGLGSLHENKLKEMAASCSLSVVCPPPACTVDCYATPTHAEESGGMEAEAPRPLPYPWTITSFSSLTRESHAYGGYDPSPEPTESPLSTTSPPMAEPNLFLKAPRGKAIGTFVHDWIERWDFGPPDLTALEAHLARYNLSSSEGQTSLKEAMPSLLDALRRVSLPRLNSLLPEACPDPSASEWHFHLPLREGFRVDQLAQVFAKHQSPYADFLQELSNETLDGFLQGFIDRIGVWQSAWCVLDWKTNTLGEHPRDYTQERMLHCAFESHYFLQIHLYSVALRRYLRAFGGTAPSLIGGFLVFLRGIRADGQGGLLHITPSPAMLDDLDQLFG